MRRGLAAVLGLLCGSALAQAQHLVFTMRTHPNCPVVISSVASSRDFGFQTLSLLGDSDKEIESIYLTVVLTTDSQEEVVDGGRVFARLGPGERKTVDAFLGRMQALTARAKELKLPAARAIVFADSVEFTDGTRWDGREPLVEPRPEPARDPK